MMAFKSIRARSAKRKGGDAALKRLLGKPSDPKALARLEDDRALAEISKRIFCSGFAWSVIDRKWPGFEAAFLGFAPKRLVFQPDEFWDKLTGDARIVRHPQKILAVRHNARFVLDIAEEHGSFGKFLAAWPASDQIGLLDVLARRGARLGGMTGQYVLRFLGKDSFVTSRDVIACLRDAGLPLSGKATSRKDLRAIQAQFNAWAEETGLPYTQLSRICALSVGDNYDAATLRRRMGGDEA